MTEQSGMLAAVAEAAGVGDKPIEITADFMRQHFPSLVAGFVSEGATAERERIRGIEAAAMPGHEAIIAAHKADATKTAADAALAVIAAENAARTGKLKQLEADEVAVAGLASASTASGDQPAAPQEPPAVTAKKANQYQAEQRAKGIKVSAAEAVAHVMKEG